MDPRKTVLLIAISLLLFSLGCLGSKTAAPTATLPPATSALATATPGKPVDTATPTATATPTQPQTTVELGDLQRNEAGGFAIRTVPGYQMIPFGEMLNMLAPDADPDTGPVVTVIGGTVDKTTVHDLYNQLKSGATLQVGPAEPIVVHGLPGLAADLSGENNGKPMRGRAALVMVTPTQQFVLLLGAPTTQWDQVAPLFDALLASVEFFAPTVAELPVVEAPTATPAAGFAFPSGRYPYTNPNAARDVLVYDGVVYVATLGGAAVWEVSPTLEDGYATIYTPLDGLSHVSTNALALCDVPVADGGRATRIILGTLTGLSFYDPMTGDWDATSITPPESNVQTAKIDRLYCDTANNRLLIGYSGLGILDLETGAWTRFTDKEGLSWNGVSDIAVTGRDIWVASGYNGISRISDGRVTVYDESNGLPNKRANALAVGPDGALWVGTSGGLARLKDDQWSFYAAQDVAGLADIRRLALANDGTLWVGTASIGGGNLCHFDPAAGKCVETLKDANGVLGLTIYHNGAPLWVNNTGLYAWVEGQKSTLVVGGVMPATNFVDSFAFAPDGSLWVGTDGGIHRLDPLYPDGEWSTYTRADGVGGSSSWAAALAVAPDGTVWAAIINGDVSRFRDGKWTHYEGLRSYESVAVDAQGRAWLGKKDKGIVVLNADGSKAMELTTTQGLPTDNVTALLADGETMWIALDVGLARYANNKVELVLDKDTLPHPYLRDLALTPDGQLLIGANLSILCYDGQQVEVLYNLQKAGFKGWLNVLAVAPDGTIWAGTQNGVLRSAADQTWTHLTTADGLLTNFITALYVDPYGGVWIGGGSNTAGGGLLYIVP